MVCLGGVLPPKPPHALHRELRDFVSLVCWRWGHPVSAPEPGLGLCCLVIQAEQGWFGLGWADFLVLLPQSSRLQLCRSIACFELLLGPHITSLVLPQKTFGLAPALSSPLWCWARSRLQFWESPILFLVGPVWIWGQQALGLGSGAGIRHLPQLRDPP